MIASPLEMAKHSPIDAGSCEQPTPKCPGYAGARHVLTREVKTRDRRLRPKRVAHDPLGRHVEPVEGAFAMSRIVYGGKRCRELMIHDQFGEFSSFQSVPSAYLLRAA